MSGKFLITYLCVYVGGEGKYPNDMSDKNLQASVLFFHLVCLGY